MFALSLLINIIQTLKIKNLFNFFIYFILAVSIILSIKVMYNSHDPKIISRSGNSIYSVSYNDRRFFSSRWDMKLVKDVVDNVLKKNATIGLMTGGDDWDYIYFGKKFEKKLYYLTYDSWRNNNIIDLMNIKELDGIIINTDINEFSDGGFSNVIEKIKEKIFLKIDESNFQNYIKPLSGCEFITEKNVDGLLIKALNDDPYLETTFPFKFNNKKTVIILIAIDSPVEATMQIFYGKQNAPYNEKDSERFKLTPGLNYIYIKIEDIQNIKSLRIDPLNINSDCIIKEIEFFSIQDINYVKLENFVILFK